MNKIFKKPFNNNIYDTSFKKYAAIFISPVIITFFIVILILIPSTKLFGYWLLKENNPVEILTFLVFLVAGIYGLVKALKSKSHLGLLFTIFYVFFSIVLILIAMEEIAWGQWFFHFDTPDEWKALNVQGETTLHNLSQIQGQNDVLRFIYGLGGLVGILIGRIRFFKKVCVPEVLILWFAIITVYAGIDVITDYIEIDSGMLRAIYAITEAIELLIAISAFLYLWLNFRIMKLGHK